MIVTDLWGKVPKGSFIETVKSKINNTFCTVSNHWMYITTDFGLVNSSWNMNKSDLIVWKGSYATTHDGGISVFEGKDLNDINTEPEWPSAGWYYIDGHTVYMRFLPNKSYKAGLPNSIFKVIIDGEDVNEFRKTWALNNIHKSKYPKKEEALEILLGIKNVVHVPLSREIVLGAWPFSEAPTLFYKGFAVGIMLPTYELIPAVDDEAIEEMIQHLENSYA